MKTFHLDFVSFRPSYNSPILSLARIAHSTPIALDLLHLSTNFDHRKPLLILLSKLLPRFDPVRVDYDTRGRSFDDPPIFSISGLPVLSTFHRLTTLELKGMLPVIWNPSIFSDSYHLAYLPLPTISRRRTVRLHLPTLLSSDAPDTTTFLKDTKEMAGLNLEHMQEGSVVLVVRSEEERREAEEAVEKFDEVRRIKFVVELKVRCERSFSTNSTRPRRLAEFFFFSLLSFYPSSSSTRRTSKQIVLPPRLSGRRKEPV